MIKFSELPVKSEAADHLYELLLKDLGTNPYPPEELRAIVDEGCSIAVAVLKSMDAPMEAGMKGYQAPEQHLIQMVALTMLSNTVKASIECLMVESFIRAMGLKPED